MKYFILQLIILLYAFSASALAIEKNIETRKVVLQDVDFSKAVASKMAPVKDKEILEHFLESCDSRVFYPVFPSLPEAAAKKIDTVLKPFAMKFVLTKLEDDDSCKDNALEYKVIGFSNAIMIGFKNTTFGGVHPDRYSYYYWFDLQGNQINDQIIPAKNWKKIQTLCEKQVTEDQKTHGGDASDTFADGTYSGEKLILSPKMRNTLGYDLKKHQVQIDLSENYLLQAFAALGICNIPNELLNPAFLKRL